MTSKPFPSVAIMGAGAVGCYYGGMLALAGAPVTLVGRAQHVDAIRRDGLAIARSDRRDIVRAEASTDVAAVSDADVVLVCVKSGDTVAAARQLKAHLRDESVVVSLQNGVDNARQISSVVEQVVMTAVVWVGAYMEGPGAVRHTGRGDLELGVPRESANRARAAERVEEVASMFERAGVQCPVVPDIEAALWTKLIVNCAFNAVSALGRARYGRMARESTIRTLMEATVHESVAVARASGVVVDERALVTIVWRTADALASQFSSTAQDILRGKPTEIDMLNGYVARRAEALSVPAPVNATLHALVKLREAGDDMA